MIVHREYTNDQPCSFIIYADRVETENANNPHGHGPINPDNFAPFPKNTAIAKFFIQLGRVDELGSGVMNVNRLIKEYSNKGKVQFIEGVTFKTIIPVTPVLNEGAVKEAVGGAIVGATSGVKGNLGILLRTIAADEGKRAPDYIKVLIVSERTMERYLQQLRKAYLIEFKEEAAQTGGYYLTNKLKEKFM